MPKRLFGWLSVPMRWVYTHLRAIAQRSLADEKPGHTLQATALVHEAFVRMEKAGVYDMSAPAARGPFYWAAAEAMRRILIDHARAKKASKRGGGAVRKELTDSMIIAETADFENLESFEVLDGAMMRLQEQDPRAGDVVRLRFFAGLSVEQAAQALGITPRCAKRDWEYARAWLMREVGRQDGIEQR